MLSFLEKLCINSYLNELVLRTQKTQKVRNESAAHSQEGELVVKVTYCLGIFERPGFDRSRIGRESTYQGKSEQAGGTKDFGPFYNYSWRWYHEYYFLCIVIFLTLWIVGVKEQIS